MYDMPNHKERRKIAKSLGLLKQRSKLPFSKYCAELQRAIETGKEIHRKKTEIMYRILDEQESGKVESVEQTPTENTKKAHIEKLYATTGETRSYGELVADVEIVSWRNRYSGKNY